MSERNTGIGRRLLVFALPLMASSLLQQLYNTVDALIVGRFLNATALAAVGASSLLINILIYFFIGLSTGASVRISQAIGEGRQGTVDKTLSSAAALALVVGAALTVVGWFGAPTFLTWMNTPAAGMADAVIYVRLYCLGMIPMAVYNMGTGAMRAVGDTRSPLLYLAVGTALHLALDLAFIPGLGLGIGGAALATTCSQVIPAVMVAAKLVRGVDRLRLKSARLYPDAAAATCRIGVPAGLQSVVMCLANVIVQSQVNTFGITIMASAAAYYKVEGFLFMPIEALALAVSNFVAEAWGAGDVPAMAESRRACYRLNIGITLAICAVYLLFSKPLIAIFTRDAAVIDWGVRQMHWCIPLYFIYAHNQTLAGSLRGEGRTFWPMVISLICICGLRVGWILAGLYGLGLRDPRVIYTAYPATWIATGLALRLYDRFVKNRRASRPEN